MKERPILFNAAMVRAILDGRKTQTRRVWKQPTTLCMKDDYLYADSHHAADGHNPIARDEIVCPYGRPGDRLWVRETFCGHPPVVFYRATEPGGDTDAMEPPKWTPSIYMPRECSRITLEITNVRVDRLQSTTEKDAIAEGAGVHMGDGFYKNEEGSTGRARPLFQLLWEKINGEESWRKNPWVWVIEFKRIKP